MTMWSDETLALSVTKATMQDWQAAIATVRDAPPTFFDARPLAHPAVVRPAIERRAAAGREPAARFAAPHTVTGGARTAYRLVLVCAMAVLAYI
jgi:hypothetical protein